MLLRTVEAIVEDAMREPFENEIVDILERVPSRLRFPQIHVRASRFGPSSSENLFEVFRCCLFQVFLLQFRAKSILVEGSALSAHF